MRHSAIVTFAAAFALTLSACPRSSTAPVDERRAELLEVQAPSSVTPGTAFDVVAYYGVGSCDSTRRITEQEQTGARLGLHLIRNPQPAGTACPDLMIRDSVALHVRPPVTLPYTVHVERASGADSLVVVRAAP